MKLQEDLSRCYDKNVSKKYSACISQTWFPKLHTRDAVAFFIKRRAEYTDSEVVRRNAHDPSRNAAFSWNADLNCEFPLALYMPHVTINVLQILATSFLMTCSPVSGCLPSRANTQPILAKSRLLILIAHCFVYKSMTSSTSPLKCHTASCNNTWPD